MDNHRFFCSYCSKEIYNNAKYDFTRYLKAMKKKGVTPQSTKKNEDLPDNLLFLIDTKTIDDILNDSNAGEKIFKFVKKENTELIEETNAIEELKSDEEDAPINESKSDEAATPIHEESLDNFCKYIFDGNDKKLIRDGKDFHYNYIKCETEIIIILAKGMSKTSVTAKADEIINIEIRRCPNCLNILSNELGKYEMVNIGLIGSVGAGKSSFLIAIHSFLVKNKLISDQFGLHKIEILRADTTNEPNPTDSRLANFSTIYDAGITIPKTEVDNSNATNLNIKITPKEGKMAKIINIVDVAGEFWKDPSGNVNFQKLYNERPIIKECDYFIICMADNDIVQNNNMTVIQVNSKFAPNIVAVIEDLRTLKNKPINCCCIINKIDKLLKSPEYGIEHILKHISYEGMLKAKYFEDERTFINSNGSYKNLKITAKEIFNILSGKAKNKHPFMIMKNIDFFPISPYGFLPLPPPEGKSDNEIVEMIDKGELLHKKPNPWHLEAFFTWIIHQTELYVDKK